MYRGGLDERKFDRFERQEIVCYKKIGFPDDVKFNDVNCQIGVKQDYLWLR